jgi:glucose-6-phosphate-specific signal transduction histidine kinase
LFYGQAGRYTGGRVQRENIVGPQSAAVLAAVLSISLLHHLVPPSLVHWHNIFQYLYFLPIAWAALSFGWRGGLAAAFLAGVSYLPDIVTAWRALPDSAIDQATDIPPFGVAGVFVGLIAERERRQRMDLEESRPGYKLFTTGGWLLVQRRLTVPRSGARMIQRAQPEDTK